MDYELRIIADCPNSAAALEIFRQVLAAEGVKDDVVVIELGSEEQAQTLRFHGSPSFIASGRDLFPSSAAPALTCRLYRHAGGLAGLPSPEDLRAAVISADSGQ